MEIINYFTDLHGEEYELWESVYKHITEFHPEINLDLIKMVLIEPDYIFRSKWDEESCLYYKRIDNYYKVVIIDKIMMRIKTALTTDKIKQGELLWKEK